MHPIFRQPPTLFQAILEKKEKKMFESPCLLLLLFLLCVCLIRPGNSSKFRKSYLCVLQLFFCAVDTFLIQLRCCLYFGGPLAASKTKQNSGILFQQDIEVSSQDKGKSSQYCICKAELIISWQGISSLF